MPKRKPKPIPIGEPLEPTRVERMVGGIWLLRPKDSAMPYWLWQWIDAPDGKEYEITWPGGGVEGHVEWFRSRADALRSLGLPPTD